MIEPTPYHGIQLQPAFEESHRSVNPRLYVSLLKELLRSKFFESDYNSIIGILWMLVNPVLSLIIFYVIFSETFGHSIGAYPLFLLSGIVCHGFFISVVGQLIPILVVNREFLINTTVPPLCLVYAEVLYATVRFCVELSLCLLLSVAYGHFSFQGLAGLFPLLLMFCAFTMGAGLLLALAFCFARDILNVWNLAGRLLLFVTPIFYSLGDITGWAGWFVYWLNPLTPFVLAFRSIFLGGTGPDLLTTAHCFAVCALFLAAGYRLFSQSSRMLIERV